MVCVLTSPTYIRYGNTASVEKRRPTLIVSYVCHKIFYYVRRRSEIYRVGQKNCPPPYILLFIVLLYLFTFTNNILCKLKLCPTHTEAQTKLVCQQVLQKKITKSKHPHVIMSQWQNTTAMHAYGYIQVTSIQVTAAYNNVQQPDSQVNNCSMCPP